jgi:Ca2+-binding EF-hand superfamily protein
MTRKTLSTLIVAMLATTAFAAAAHGPGKDDKFKMMDTNSDGQISAAEHAAGITKMFSDMDADKDGFVTTTEIDARHAAKGETAGKSDMKSSDKIATMDKDGDGKLSAAEYDTGAADIFKKMDTDNSGAVSQAEMSSAHGKMMSDQAKDKEPAAGMTDHSGHDADSGTTPTPDGNGG